MCKKPKEQGIESRQKIYDFLVSFITKNGYSPTIREISDGTGLKSTATIYRHLMVLEQMGMIHLKDNKTRAISLVGYEFKRVGG
ncbi:LexA repressor [[Clostridium] scindens]|uniref:LexA family protein n=1 Tax=Clostridium scindens (strain JCM 10418 / VPI 12708) TaxID=29347 RepID=UPI001D08EE58|nr:LexA repressor [[Clostridium] scindens]MCB6288568.1 LexA repressor [[Clostridium] scindens]MCB6423033.1 LexA repressor [[Clostridium] scindens]MCB7194886.1 LexA repressor [[Clostridium] scindens]MCB7288087.1 LexA repressor [[Clostridium] scindens]MCG4931045.1 LexA repressor [[Clostridium] scindens]